MAIMTIIDSTLTGVSIGTPWTFENLAVFPLLGGLTGESDYDILDAALGRGTLAVTEVSDSGHVPELTVVNRGARPVLVVDGEELVGAKQNRTVNLSILVPANADIRVPVTCVEAGRWSMRSRRFESSPRTHFAAGRAAKSRQVSQSLMATGVPAADQAQVWDAIASKSARLQAPSATGAMADIFDARRASIEDYVDAVDVDAGQVGAVFVLDGQPMGIDLFDTAPTLRALGDLDDLLDSFAAIRPVEMTVSGEALERLLDDFGTLRGV